MKKRLTKSYTDRIVGGVCGGLGTYLGVDSALIRIFWTALTLAFGIGLPIYIICCFIMPDGEI